MPINILLPSPYRTSTREVYALRLIRDEVVPVKMLLNWRIRKKFFTKKNNCINMIIIIIIGTIECIIVDYFFKVITAFFTIIHLSPIC